MKKYLIFLIIITLPIALQAQSCFSERYKYAMFNDVTVYKDIRYARAVPFANQITRQLENYHFDFYEPTGDTLTKRPLIMMFAGGDFQTGGKDNSEVKTWCDSLAQYGFTCAAIDFRLGYDKTKAESVERAIYRSVQDARAAIRFFKENHLTFKIDTSQIFIGGDESGAVTALYTAYMDSEETRFASSRGSKWEPSDLGCLDCSGNPFEHSVSVAGVINLRGELTADMLTNAKSKIPVMHVHDEAQDFVPVDPTKNPLDHLRMKGVLNLHEEMAKNDIPSEIHSVPLMMGSGINMTASIEEIWSTVWGNIHNFLYNTISFDTETPKGSDIACSGITTTYSVAHDDGSSYCWVVFGGTIMKDRGHEIEVMWDYNIDKGQVKVTKKNPLEVVGRPSLPLNVEIRTRPKADFDVMSVADNIIAVQDNTTNDAFFSLYFGDGSDQRIAVSGDVLFHTYTSTGEYVISQVLESTCGVVVDTRTVEIPNITFNSFAQYLEEKIAFKKETIQKGETLDISIELPFNVAKITIDLHNENKETLATQTVNNALTTSFKIATEKLETGSYSAKITIGDVSVVRDFVVE